ncbi:hypothetical protein ANN_21133 [Periplaneta americana]|uniref:Reverse transcriptase zinc-binding domain-containing protein n=1 Tax=Periplaneta americana TaxID=6978 RepID=A0ABQ8SEU5_PERAM|nr:hypothetical protein ANN_21133 [Periplaneta americana]
MTANVAPVRAIPVGVQTNRCRTCSEIETLPHVLGSCPFGEALSNSRHHSVRSSIATAVLKKDYTVFEVHCLASNGNTRRIDMIGMQPPAKKSWLFNDVVSTTGSFKVGGIGDSEMVFGEVRPRIRHRLPDIRLTVGETLGKKPNQGIGPNGNRTQLRVDRQAP